MPVPVPAPAPAATPAPAPVESLLPGDAPAPPVVPQTDAEKLAAAKALIAAAEAAADPNARNPDGSKAAWLLHDGVMGQGEKPSWFKQDKYATVSKQAEAYVALESRFGSFVGAPKDGVYTLNLPQNVPADMVNKDSPLFTEFSKWAAKEQLSQEGFNQLIGYLAQDTMSRAPNMATIKGRLGDNADGRISAVATWGKANLGDDGYQVLRQATSGANAAEVFQVLERVIAKTSQLRMPKPGADVPGAGAGNGLADIQKAHGARTADGKLRVNVEPAYRTEIEKRYRDFYAVAEQA